MLSRRNFLFAGAAAVLAGTLPRIATAGYAQAQATEWTRRRSFLGNASGRIAYVDAGSGDAVLMLHGYPLNGFQWRGVVEQLSLAHRCIVPDFMGLGWSVPAHAGKVDPWSQVRMLVSLLDHLRISSVHVIANDSGGAVAQLLALEQPSRIASLLLTNCDTALQSPPPAMHEVIELSKQGRYASTWLDPWLEHTDKARAPDGFGGMCYSDPENPTDEAIRMYFGPLLSSIESRRRVEAYAIALEENVLSDANPRFKSLRVPVRILWGQDDVIFSRENADFLDRSWGNSHGVRKVAHAKLFWPEEQPGLIVEEARALWSTLKS